MRSHHPSLFTLYNPALSADEIPRQYDVSPFKSCVIFLSPSPLPSRKKINSFNKSQRPGNPFELGKPGERLQFTAVNAGGRKEVPTHDRKNAPSWFENSRTSLETFKPVWDAKLGRYIAEEQRWRRKRAAFMRARISVLVVIVTLREKNERDWWKFREDRGRLNRIFCASNDNVENIELRRSVIDEDEWMKFFVLIRAMRTFVGRKLYIYGENTKEKSWKR